MVIFSGVPDDHILKYLMTKISRRVALMSLCSGVAMLLLAMVLAQVFNGYDDVLELLIFSAICIVLGIVIYLNSFRVKADDERENITIKITQDYIEGKYAPKRLAFNEIPTDKVKKVLDYGEFYYIMVNRFDFVNGVFCQKNLITEGTIEEFEAIFKDKLVRKNMKNTKKNP